jgi:DICT domain-containing protein
MTTVFDKTKVVKSIRFYGDTLAYVTYAMEDDFVDVLPNTNVVIAAFVTAQARLKLYTYLEKLQERVLYMDTGILLFLYFFSFCCHKMHSFFL